MKILDLVIKKFFEILSGLFFFLPLISQKVFIVPPKSYKLFFFKFGEWGKNLSFHTGSKNLI
jgi:hypothetical protein